MAHIVYKHFPADTAELAAVQADNRLSACHLIPETSYPQQALRHPGTAFHPSVFSGSPCYHLKT